jgi:isopentenyl-diphosphate delta-isomerase
VENLNRVVSSEAEELILVDEDDREQGHLSKAACHDGAGVLHRAFSAFATARRIETIVARLLV